MQHLKLLQLIQTVTPLSRHLPHHIHSFSGQQAELMTVQQQISVHAQQILWQQPVKRRRASDRSCGNSQSGDDGRLTALVATASRAKTGSLQVTCTDTMSRVRAPEKASSATYGYADARRLAASCATTDWSHPTAGTCATDSTSVLPTWERKVGIST